MHLIPEFVAVFAWSLFTGALIYINLVEHPARMECGVEIAATEFPPSYRGATIMQVFSTLGRTRGETMKVKADSGGIRHGQNEVIAGGSRASRSAPG
jgi:hypothetical protein